MADYLRHISPFNCLVILLVEENPGDILYPKFLLRHSSHLEMPSQNLKKKKEEAFQTDYAECQKQRLQSEFRSHLCKKQ